DSWLLSLWLSTDVIESFSSALNGPRCASPAAAWRCSTLEVEFPAMPKSHLNAWVRSSGFIWPKGFGFAGPTTPASGFGSASQCIPQSFLPRGHWFSSESLVPFFQDGSSTVENSVKVISWSRTASLRRRHARSNSTSLSVARHDKSKGALDLDVNHFGPC